MNSTDIKMRGRRFYTVSSHIVGCARLTFLDDPELWFVCFEELAQGPSHCSTAQPEIGREGLGAADGNTVACRIAQGLTAATGLRGHHRQKRIHESVVEAQSVL